MTTTPIEYAEVVSPDSQYFGEIRLGDGVLHHHICTLSSVGQNIEGSVLTVVCFAHKLPTFIPPLPLTSEFAFESLILRWHNRIEKVLNIWLHAIIMGIFGIHKAIISKDIQGDIWEG